MSELTENVLFVRLESDEHPELRVTRLEGRESLSSLFQFDVDVVTVGESDLDPQALVGVKTTLVFEEAGVTLRQVHATVVRVRQHLDAGVDRARYHLRLLPRAHATRLVETYEVFLDKTVPEILQEKLLRAGLKAEDMVFKLSARYAPREFVLQYRESDFAFLSRLAEHVGIAYRFDHQAGRDVITFTDSNGSLDVESREIAFDLQAGGKGIHGIARETSIFPGRHVVDDYSDQHPKLELLVEQVVDDRYPGEVVEWAAGYTSVKDGGALAAVRAQERVVANRFYEGKCGRPLAAGDVVDVTGHPKEKIPTLRVTHVDQLVEQGAQLATGEAPPQAYVCSFRAVLASDPFRPERRTPRPRIDGFVHAITEPGPAGVAQLDDQGRYTVQFLFDRADPARRVSSARVRMMQAHAGPNYGIHFPLKPDVEVLVAFAEGDPDRPLIAGCVPNTLTPSPVTSKNPRMHRIETLTGLYIRMKDQ